MPAVKLDQLKLESANLAGNFSRPEQFCVLFRELLGGYSNRTFRLQAATGRLKPTPSYHIPDQVLRQVERDVLAQLKAHEQAQALALADALWSAPSYEEKYLAIALLGATGVEPAEPILERFNSWYAAAVDHRLASFLAVAGSRGLRTGARGQWQSVRDSWLKSRRTSGLAHLMLAASDDLETNNLHWLQEGFSTLTQVLQTDDLAILPEALGFFGALARKGEAEAVYFLREIAAGEERTQLVERFIARAGQTLPDKARVQINR
jgi:hypothetical protein